jgi:4-carboxymuconolactone decarboxylase
MRLTEPRIAPLAPSEWTDEQRAALEPFSQRGQLYNIFSTLGRNPDALQAFLAWGSYVLRRSQLSPRERELLILRVGFLCDSSYEWAQHVRLAKHAGMTEEEIGRIRRGPDEPDWTSSERVLLRAADELHSSHFVSDETWRSMRAFLSERQCMDVVFVVGHYTQVCMILNSFGIQLDAELLS